MAVLNVVVEILSCSLTEDMHKVKVMGSFVYATCVHNSRSEDSRNFKSVRRNLWPTDGDVTDICNELMRLLFSQLLWQYASSTDYSLAQLISWYLYGLQHYTTHAAPLHYFSRRAK